MCDVMINTVRICGLIYILSMLKWIVKIINVSVYVPNTFLQLLSIIYECCVAWYASAILIQKSEQKICIFKKKVCVYEI